MQLSCLKSKPKMRAVVKGNTNEVFSKHLSIICPGLLRSHFLEGKKTCTKKQPRALKCFCVVDWAGELFVRSETVTRAAEDYSFV